MKPVSCAVVALAFCALAPISVSAAQLESLRLHESPEYTRVVFDTTAPVRYRAMVLENPHRFVIDFEDVSLGPAFDPTAVALGRDRVDGVRVGRRGDGYRIVLDVTAKLQPKDFTLLPVDPYGHRVVVDLYDTGARAAPRIVVTQPRGKRDVVVAVDAGHGGEDPGALGPGRLQEKTVVLSIARKLEAMIDAEPGFDAFLVRDGDYYIGHAKRRQIARDRRADLFVSIHADGFESSQPNGASVYTLSDRGATSETAAYLADKENRSDLIGGVGTISLDDKPDGVAEILLDISMDAFRIRSIEVGGYILEQLGKTTKLHKQRVEQAAFLVLKAPDVASVLVETGFISNPAEARRLNQRDYQEDLSRAIVRGIAIYMNEKPPTGTLLAWQREHGGVRYTISRGDTLSEIAVRYGVSAERIRRANKLSNDAIHVGQVIIIPAG
ncbi:MAG: N-acetylmuramoyl-L-alanine amidase [Pseudomonadales bacterium]|nr:N-acetylmuramoyl-L-alanine amidase [Pseudomonadales bacterium]MDP6827399.1 N-acetylmuramoyl-L-alanine amidase [Pseudomonadales bacterium]MDP6971222.1 N-acetylmuramoyl-L-alanine amidase [Pseudomonadales bacterium]